VSFTTFARPGAAAAFAWFAFHHQTRTCPRSRWRHCGSKPTPEQVGEPSAALALPRSMGENQLPFIAGGLKNGFSTRRVEAGSVLHWDIASRNAPSSSRPPASPLYAAGRRGSPNAS
jgi:hypothetical protein